MSLEAIKFNKTDKDNLSVEILDQLLLPYVTKYIPIYNIDDGFSTIKNMQVRGAPAIAMVGALSVLLEIQLLNSNENIASQWYEDLSNWERTKIQLKERLEYLLSSRPTAVNLGNALNDISKILENSKDITTLKYDVYQYTCQLLENDLKDNITMGNNGANTLLALLEKEDFHSNFGVLTICNTGSLATAGYGTALGVIRSLWEDSRKKIAEGKNDCAKMTHVFPLETRPYNQGSRLTAYELVHDKIPATLITDSSIAYKIATSPLPIKAAFVGADRIVRNGDTANKIGTFQLAVICKQFGIKFFVVAPKTTIDNKTPSGDGIIVEERNAEEFKLVSGTLVDANTFEPLLDQNNKPISAKVGIAPPEVKVWNPSFDVTPHEFIDGIVTEVGVFTKNEKGNFTLEELF
ncbi:similar to Saccharomyces cerevisiae YPR118W MRI1 5'-methylthioribose-1-phosphate isomerase [Maudiozyma saulgeensis]|uniref:Methylthioribose-1-phosphate isomerase n=1 Tax=Maudiozyma saulgeensis TaxID=1789683 RepID=A0A1X7QXM3_9SACH|nr:similar to Saccharomyces cerevisiae YPR118W MRI1 5'-methylthioribose-1-phosphate isomerase [Kazachstania saulgeensis]